jgi:hemerythrin-like domain-containing protein
MTPKARTTIQALDACHQQIHLYLDKLQVLLGYLRADDDEALIRQMAGEIEVFFSGTSRQHHLEEEAEIFPPLLKSDDAELVQAVQTLRQDHNWLELNWTELAPMLRAVEQGEDWVDLEHLQHAIKVYVNLSHDHIALEETLIYPQARANRAAELAKRQAG